MLENYKMVGHWYEGSGWSQWFKWISLAALLNQLKTKKYFLNKQHQSCFSFIFSETPLSPAAAVVNIASDEFHYGPVCHLKLRMAHLFGHHSLHHAAVANHMSVQPDTNATRQTTQLKVRQLVLHKSVSGKFANIKYNKLSLRFFTSRTRAWRVPV